MQDVKPKDKIKEPRSIVKDLTPEEVSLLAVGLSVVAKTDKLEELKREHHENIQDMKTLAAEGEGNIQLSRASVILSKQVSKILRKVEGGVQDVSALSTPNHQSNLSASEVTFTFARTCPRAYF